MSIVNYTEAQKKGLYEMLKNSKSMTPAEKTVFAALREYLAEIIYNGGARIMILDGYIKEAEIDTCGVNYSPRWTKLKESSKGLWYFSNFQQRRLYLI